MFGFSIGKVIFTVAAIVAVWYAFKIIGRLQARQQELKELREREDARAAKEAGRTAASPEVKEMVKCRVCESFIAESSTRNCGRENCPYPG